MKQRKIANTLRLFWVKSTWQVSLIAVFLSLVLYASGMCAEPQCEPSEVAAVQRFETTRPAMGGLFTIVLYASDKGNANAAFDTAFERIEALDTIMSDYRPESEISRLGAASPMDKGIPVSDDLWRVLSQAKCISIESKGAFDVTVGPMSRLWRRARRQKRMPSDERLKEAREAVGHQFIQLDENEKTIRLTQGKMRLDLGGIAKGDAADQALAELKKLGITRALVNAGGDIALGDPPPDAKGWKVGVAPLKPKGKPSRILMLCRCGIATSGDAWQFVVIDGKRYSHIVDPHTGLGVTRRGGVTVIAPTAMAADALASTVSVLGPEAGIKLVAKKPGVSTLVVEAVEDEVKLHQSEDFPTGK